WKPEKIIFVVSFSKKPGPGCEAQCKSLLLRQSIATEVLLPKASIEINKNYGLEVRQQYPPVLCTRDERGISPGVLCTETRSINQCRLEERTGSFWTAMWTYVDKRSRWWWHSDGLRCAWRDSGILLPRERGSRL